METTQSGLSSQPASDCSQLGPNAISWIDKVQV